MMSWPSVPKAEIGYVYSFHSGPAVNCFSTGIWPCRLWAVTRNAYVLPSPLAQKLISFLAERFTVSCNDDPGENAAPANRNCDPGKVSPLTRKAPRELLAPPSTS